MRLGSTSLRRNIKIRLFGFQIRRPPDTTQSFVEQTDDDGAVVVAAGGSVGTYVDLEGTVRTEAELVSRYRDMSLHPEIDSAVDEIVNDAICMEEANVVNIILDDLDIEDNSKQILMAEFEDVLELLDFNNKAYQLFRRWYIDGRLYFHAVIDEKAVAEGVKELRYIDPRKIRKIREQMKRRGGSDAGMQNGEGIITTTVNEYFIYNERGFNVGPKSTSTPAAGIRIAKDSIVHVPSGLTDTNGSMVLSYLHKAIKPLNQLRTLEDATVIYRLSRAPERRVWYIDVGNLPKMKAEQYLRDMMMKHKNKVVYDGQSGEIRDDRKFMTMLEDYWLPRRENGRGTEVVTLDGGQNLGEMDDVLYFQKKLYRSLNVPVDRIENDSTFNFGQVGQITREELKFAKFINRLRNQFCSLFLDILEKQVILKGIMGVEDWDNLSHKIRFDFTKDNYYAELMNEQILGQRMQLLETMMPFVGRYYSNAWVRKNVLKQNDDEMQEMDMEIMAEMYDPQYQMQMDGGGGGDPGQEDEEGSMATDGASSAGSQETGQSQDYVTALKQYKQLKSVKKRTPTQIHNLRSVAQILAKGQI